MIKGKVLVTGGTGYVGTALVPLLAKDRPVRVFCRMDFGNSIAGTPNVEFVKGDVQDIQAVMAALEGCEAVVHLAGIVTDDLVDMNPDLGFQVNRDATYSIVRAARQAGVRRFIYASSSSVYGSVDVPATEETPCHPETAYALSKLEGEQVALAQNVAGFAVCALRSATCMGPSPRMRLDTIVNVFSKQAWFDRRITVHGGDQWRSNVHVEDAARAYQALLDEPRTELIAGQVYNLSAGYHTALELAQLVAKVFNSSTAYTYGGFYRKEATIEVDLTRHDSRHYKLNTDKLGGRLYFRPQYGVEEAARDNFRFFNKGGLGDPNDPIYYNTRRMEASVKGEK